MNVQVAVGDPGSVNDHAAVQQGGVAVLTRLLRQFPVREVTVPDDPGRLGDVVAAIVDDFRSSVDSQEGQNPVYREFR